MSEKKELLLRAKDISIVFGGLRAVSDFDLELYQGELIGLIGPNGAGKTTVFNMLSGIYKPTSGTITFVGRDENLQVVSGKSPAQLNRIGIARTFQNIRLFGHLTAAENIKIALHQTRTVTPIDVLLRTKKFRDDEKIMQEKTELLLSIFHLDSKKMNLRTTCLMVSSVSLKFAARLLPVQNCFCLMSRRLE